ncbi:MAG: hypothetical protein J6A66_07415 [Alistipes sp.]|nr:hypothetical protein [Alistipes sp.]
MIGCLGGLEFIKWLFTRKANSKIADAQADSAKIQAEEDEFHLKKERLKFADEQLLEQEKRYADLSDKYYEQTLLVRKLNEQAIEREQTIGQQKAEIAELKAERKMKLCERRGCDKRVPQSGY